MAAPGRKMSMARARVTVYIGPKRGRVDSKGKRPVYVDSGATITSINEAMLPAMETIAPLRKKMMTVQTANGTKETLIVENLVVCLDRKTCYRGPMAVTGDTIGDVLVGTDFMLANKCKIDFDRKTFHCGDKKFTFKVEA